MGHGRAEPPARRGCAGTRPAAAVYSSNWRSRFHIFSVWACICAAYAPCLMYHSDDVQNVRTDRARACAGDGVRGAVVVGDDGDESSSGVASGVACAQPVPSVPSLREPHGSARATCARSSPAPDRDEGRVDRLEPDDGGADSNPDPGPTWGNATLVYARPIWGVDGTEEENGVPWS